jgi:tRNA nucleotidyltransferase (CCA-adding enzyme)
MPGFPNYSFHSGSKENSEGIVTTAELQRLLNSLRKNSNTRIRFRLLGKMWDESFVTVRDTLDIGAVFEHPASSNELIGISDLRNIIQFELENSFEHYAAHFHYLVRP